MPGLYDQFTDRENFYIAFKKLRHYLDQANEWYDPIAWQNTKLRYPPGYPPFFISLCPD